MHGEAVHLRFAVWDRWVVARHTAPNSAVYQDACVEFFFSCAEGMYINVETNCIGCSLVQRHAIGANPNPNPNPNPSPNPNPNPNPNQARHRGTARG